MEATWPLAPASRSVLRRGHMLLLMAHENGELDSLVRKRIRALRVAQGLSLEELAGRAHVSQSTLSRIENGQRRLALDQLVTLARALDTSLDQLVETAADDVVINPVIDGAHGQTRWPMRAEPGMSVVRQRLTEPPPTTPPACGRTRAMSGSWCSPAPRSSCWAIAVCGSRRIRPRSSPPCSPTPSARMAAPARSSGSSTATPGAATSVTAAATVRTGNDGAAPLRLARRGL